MILLLVLYLIVMMGIAIYDLSRIKNFEDYAVAGKKQRTYAVVMTMLATIIGASSTVGLIDTTYNIGFPAIWWLLFGALGLLLQSIFISKKIRNLNADTLPQAAGIMVAPIAERVIAAVIVISWIGVVAGQLVALSSIVSYIVGSASKWVFIGVAIIVILYTTLGGQLSVVRTDRLQFIIILSGLVICCAYLYFFAGQDSHTPLHSVEFLNSDYRPIDLVTQFFVIGGVYLLGPDMLSRNLISRDSQTAKRSAIWAGISLVIIAIVIVGIGMWARANVATGESGTSKMLMYLIDQKIPRPIGILLTFALLSSILSSTDTCLINASSIFVKDLLQRDSVRLIRITVCTIGAMATVIAVAGRGDIIALLSGAYSIYTSGVIFPLFIAIYFYGKRQLRTNIWIAAVSVGGICGLIGVYMPNTSVNFALIGMALSLVIAMMSVKRRVSSK